VRNITVSPESGEPDECGDPPPEITIPDPPAAPGPPREPFNPGPGINIDIGVEINIDGSINVDFGTGPITIDPFGDGRREPDPNPPAPPGDGGNPPPAPPGDVGDPGEPDDADDDKPASGCAPSGSVLTGIKLNLTEIPPNAKQYADGVYRGVCYIYMGNVRRS